MSIMASTIQSSQNWRQIPTVTSSRATAMHIMSITLLNMPWISSQLMWKILSLRCSVSFPSLPKGESPWGSFDDCPRHLQALLRLTGDAAGVEEEADLVEVYLVFCINVLSLFEEVVKKLERDDTTSADLYGIMLSFLRRWTQRRDYGFYGFLTQQKLRRLSPSDADAARQEFTTFLNTAISYVRSESEWHILISISMCH